MRIFSYFFFPFSLLRVYSSAFLFLQILPSSNLNWTINNKIQFYSLMDLILYIFYSYLKNHLELLLLFMICCRRCVLKNLIENFIIFPKAYKNYVKMNGTNNCIKAFYNHIQFHFHLLFIIEINPLNRVYSGHWTFDNIPNEIWFFVKWFLFSIVS